MFSNLFKIPSFGTSLEVQWLRFCVSTARGKGQSLETKIPHDSGHNPKKAKKNYKKTNIKH